MNMHYKSKKRRLVCLFEEKEEEALHEVEVVVEEEDLEEVGPIYNVIIVINLVTRAGIVGMSHKLPQLLVKM
jgi:hypothetical protein